MSEVEPAGYAELLAQAKARIHAARTRAALAVNAELIALHWRLGRLIIERQRVARGGAKVIDRLSADVRSEFPGMRGLSASSLKYMRRVAEPWPETSIGRTVAGYRLAHLPPEARLSLPGEDELLGALATVVEDDDERRR